MSKIRNLGFQTWELLPCVNHLAAELATLGVNAPRLEMVPLLSTLSLSPLLPGYLNCPLYFILSRSYKYPSPSFLRLSSGTSQIDIPSLVQG